VVRGYPKTPKKPQKRQKTPKKVFLGGSRTPPPWIFDTVLCEENLNIARGGTQNDENLSKTGKKHVF